MPKSTMDVQRDCSKPEVGHESGRNSQTVRELMDKMVIDMTSEQAWADFKASYKDFSEDDEYLGEESIKRGINKARGPTETSLDAKLDVLSAQFNEMETDIDRLTDVIPQVVGELNEEQTEDEEQAEVDEALGEDAGIQEFDEEGNPIGDEEGDVADMGIADDMENGEPVEDAEDVPVDEDGIPIETDEEGDSEGIEGEEDVQVDEDGNPVETAEEGEETDEESEDEEEEYDSAYADATEGRFAYDDEESDEESEDEEESDEEETDEDDEEEIVEKMVKAITRLDRDMKTQARIIKSQARQIKALQNEITVQKSVRKSTESRHVPIRKQIGYVDRPNVGYGFSANGNNYPNQSDNQTIRQPMMKAVPTMPSFTESTPEQIWEYCKQVDGRNDL